MKLKVEELAGANADLQNLMASTSIATVFLDRALTIKRYTPQAVELFHLIPGDLGRPLAHLKHTLDYPELPADSERVLRTLIPVEREVNDAERWFLARLQPYRTAEDTIAGVVLTFVDVTDQKNAQRVLAEDLRDTSLLREISAQLIPEEDMQSLFDAILSAAINLTRSAAGTVQLFDPPAEQLRLLAGKGLNERMTGILATVDAGACTACGAALGSGARLSLDFATPVSPEREELNGMYRQNGLYSGQATPLIARSGRPIGMLSTYWQELHQPSERDVRLLDLLARQAADAIERKLSQDALRASEERLRMLIESAKDYAIFSTDLERCVSSWNSGAEAMFGYHGSEVLRQKADILFTPEDRAKGEPEREARLAREEGHALNERWHLRKDGSVFYGSGSVMPLRGKDGTLAGYVKIMRDLTDSKRTEEELREQMEELRRFNAVAVGRENRMIELKKEINELCVRIGDPARYMAEPPAD